jgi:hypothetical protein
MIFFLKLIVTFLSRSRETLKIVALCITKVFKNKYKVCDTGFLWHHECRNSQTHGFTYKSNHVNIFIIVISNKFFDAEKTQKSKMSPFFPWGGHKIPTRLNHKLKYITKCTKYLKQYNNAKYSGNICKFDCCKNVTSYVKQEQV